MRCNLVLGAAILGTALLAQTTADDAQCGRGSDGGGDTGGFNGLGWRENATHATPACNMPVLNAGAGGLSLGACGAHARMPWRRQPPALSRAPRVSVQIVRTC